MPTYTPVVCYQLCMFSLVNHNFFHHNNSVVIIDQFFSAALGMLGLAYSFFMLLGNKLSIGYKGKGSHVNKGALVC